MTETYICTLPSNIKECEYRDKDMKCLMNKKGCGFRKEEKKSNESEPYIKQKKWYEEYISK